MAHLRILPAGFENRPAGEPAGLALIQALPSEFVAEPAFEFMPVPFERLPSVSETAKIRSPEQAGDSRERFGNLGRGRGH